MNALKLNLWQVKSARQLLTVALISLLAGLFFLGWSVRVLGALSTVSGLAVTSSAPTYFYDPGLTTAGGTVYFNSLNGQGGGQVITVSIFISDTTGFKSFQGGTAFGTTPISATGTMSGTYNLSYTIPANSADISEPGVPFTVTYASLLTHTFKITFTQDHTVPVISGLSLSENSPYLYAPSNNHIYYSQLMTAAVPFTISGAASDAIAGLKQATFSSALGDNPPADSSPAVWQAVYTASSGNTTSGLIEVSLIDLVGNIATQTITYTLDKTAPSLPPDLNFVSDADSGADGLPPETGYDDDTTLQVTWSDSTDSASGVDVYYLGLSPSPTQTAVSTATFNVTGDGVYTVYLKVTDRVGNSASITGPNTTVDTGIPTGQTVSIAETSAYLYITPTTNINSGTLFYNNQSASSFTVSANTGGVSWGTSGLGRILFDPSWGDATTTTLTIAPFNHLYSISVSETDADGHSVYFVDRAGNVSSVSINHTLDITAPVVSVTDVTNPKYDPGADELDNAGNWHRTAELTGGWTITGTVSDGGSGLQQTLAVWDHPNDTYDQSSSNLPGTSVSHTFSGLTSNPDGSVWASLSSTDWVGNSATQTLRVRLDNTAPTNPTGLAFVADADSGGDGIAPLSGYDDDHTLDLSWTNSTDAGSGVETYLIGLTPAPAQSATSPASLTIGADGVYTAYLQARDNVGNVSAVVSSASIMADTTAPTGGTITVEELSGPEYLYLTPTLNITGGELFYNNGFASSLRVTANPDSWGTSGLRDVRFGQGWTVAPFTDSTAPYRRSFTLNPADTDADNLLKTTFVNQAGNVQEISLTLTLDVTPPAAPGSFTRQADADSGSDGYAPQSGYEDDRTVDLTWAIPSDGSGSGIRTYHLGQSSQPTTPDVGDGSTTSGQYTFGSDGFKSNLRITAEDNVGNVSSAATLTPVYIDTVTPSVSTIDVVESSAYLFIEDASNINGGELFYNNQSASSFTINANGSAGDLGGDFQIVFNPAWGHGSTVETSVYNPSKVYNISVSETETQTEVLFIDGAGNVQTVHLDTTLDTTPPSVVLTDVTDPDYDPDADELNTGYNWYRTAGLGAGWDFTASVSESASGVGQSSATWDHQVNNGDDQTIASLGITGPGNFSPGDTFTALTDDSDGSVVVTVSVTDRVNNSASDSLTLRLDGTAPSINSGGWSESSSYLHIISGDLYFSHQMPSNQNGTLSGSASDGQSGLDRMAFSNETNLASSPADDNFPASWSGAYAFNSSSASGDGQATVTLYDNVGNTSSQSFDYILDDTPPVVTLTSFTSPGYNGDGNNWYNAADFTAGPGNNDWQFFFTDSDSQTGRRSAQAHWNHSVGSASDQLNYNLGASNSGIFGNGSGTSGQAVWDDPDGSVLVTVEVEDNVGNVGTDTVTLYLDNTGPEITSGGWSDSSPYLYSAGSNLFFSPLMGLIPQSATLSGTASDNGGSGLDTASFSDEASLFSSPSSADNTPANWSGTYRIDQSSLDTTSPATVTLKDNLGNATVVSYTYQQDTTPPVLTLTNVTDPTYDPIGDELDSAGNWYKTANLSAGWAFTSTVIETGSGLTDSLTLARWEHSSVATNSQTIIPGIDGSGLFSAVSSNSDGLVTVTVIITDNVGYTAQDSVALQLDGTAPVITTPGWIETSEFLYAFGDIIYFGQDMPVAQTGIVSGTSADAGSGLDDSPLSETAFSVESSLAGSPTSTVLAARWQGSYLFDVTSDDSDNPVHVTITDNVGNARVVEFYYDKDITQPAITLTNVTDPNYDPDLDELNDTGNWYRTSVLTPGWVYSSNITVGGFGLQSISARWDHQSDNSNDQLNLTPALNGSGVVSNVLTNTDGTVIFTIVITDYTGKRATDTLTLQLDGTAPTVPISFTILPDADSGGDAFAPQADYYDDRSLEVTWADSADAGSGLGGYWLSATNTLSQPAVSGAALNVAADGVYTAYLRAIDNVGNLSAITHSQMITVDTNLPANLGLNIAEISPYLYYSPTVGLFYNNQHPSQFTVTAQIEAVDWGTSGLGWIQFDDSWGDVASTTLSAAPFSHLYQIDVAETDLNGHTVSFVDRAGNVATATIAHILDITPPSLSIVDVTDPDYDPDANELDDSGNWYRTGGLTAGWNISGATNDSGSGLLQTQALWHHSNSAYSQASPFMNEATINYTFENLTDNPDGPVNVVLESADRVGNVVTAGLTLQLDGTAPAKPTGFAILPDGDDSTNPPDGELPQTDHSDDYVLELEWDETNDGSGSGVQGYQLGPSAGGTTGLYQPSGAVYTVTADGVYTLYLSAVDYVGNYSSPANSQPVRVDTIRPTAHLSATYNEETTIFSLSWGADFDASGIAGYEVGYTVNGGPYQTWLSNTLSTADTFGPIDESESYIFSVRALDRAGNWGDYVSSQPNAPVYGIFLPLVIKNYPLPPQPFVLDDFEDNNLDNWQSGGTLGTGVSSTEAHSGSFSALLGNPAYTCTSVPIAYASLSAAFEVPASQSPSLTFWYRTFTYDANVNLTNNLDSFDVLIDNQLQFRYANNINVLNCNTLRDSGWQQQTIDLSAYKGTTVTLDFQNHNRKDNFYNTWTYIDDIVVEP